MRPSEGTPALVAGRYAIEDVIASGGMGTVHRARHVAGGHVVALKVIPFDVLADRAGATRFTREVTAAAAIGHEGIVKVLDAGVDEAHGLAFVAMELLEGETLAVRMARLETSRADTLRLVYRGLAPLAAAHAKGFVHRDVKPDNFFVARFGERELVKLLDFGLARHVAGPGVTQANVRLGTPGYMSPEQALGLPAIGASADVFAIGVILYVALAQRLPFPGPSPAQQLAQVAHEPHVPLVSIGYAIPEPLSRLVDRCLAKDPGARPRDAAELRLALASAMRASGLDPEAAPAVPPPGALATKPSRAPEVAPTQSMDVVPGPSPDESKPSVPRRRSPWGAWMLLVLLIALAWGTWSLWGREDDAAGTAALPEASETEPVAPIESGGEEAAAGTRTESTSDEGSGSSAAAEPGPATGSGSRTRQGLAICTGRWAGEVADRDLDYATTLGVQPIVGDGSCGNLSIEGMGASALHRCRPAEDGLSAAATLRGRAAAVSVECPPKTGSVHVQIELLSEDALLTGTLYP